MDSAVLSTQAFRFEVKVGLVTEICHYSTAWTATQTHDRTTIKPHNKERPFSQPCKTPSSAQVPAESRRRHKGAKPTAMSPALRAPIAPTCEPFPAVLASQAKIAAFCDDFVTLICNAHLM